MDEASNAIAAIITGVYLGGVWSKGNSDELAAALVADRGFVIWLISTMIVIAILDKAGPAAKPLGVMITLGIWLNAGPKIFPAIDNFTKRFS